MKATSLSPEAHADIVGRSVSRVREQAGSRWNTVTDDLWCREHAPHSTELRLHHKLVLQNFVALDRLGDHRYQVVLQIGLTR